MNHHPDELWMLNQYQQQAKHPAQPASNHLAEWLASIDWHKVFIVTAAMIALSCILFASYKLLAIWNQYRDWLLFLSFADQHYPLTVFSALFAFNYLQHRDSESMGMFALFSAVLNALLV